MKKYYWVFAWLSLSLTITMYAYVYNKIILRPVLIFLIPFLVLPCFLISKAIERLRDFSKKNFK